MKQRTKTKAIDLNRALNEAQLDSARKIKEHIEIAQRVTSKLQCALRDASAFAEFLIPPTNCSPAKQSKKVRTK